MTQARDIIDDALATAMHAMQTTIATTLWSTPGALTFAQDMFLNVPLIADWKDNMPIGSDVSLTMLWDKKIQRKSPIQLSWE